MSFRREIGQPKPPKTAEQARQEDLAFEQRMLRDRFAAEVDALVRSQREKEQSGLLDTAAMAFVAVMSASLVWEVIFGGGHMRSMWSSVGSLGGLAVLCMGKRAPTRKNLLLGIALGCGFAAAILVAGILF